MDAAQFLSGAVLKKSLKACPGEIDAQIFTTDAARLPLPALGATELGYTRVRSL